MRPKRRLDFLTEDTPCVLQGVKCLEEASREMRNWAVAVLFLLSCRTIIRWLFRGRPTIGRRGEERPLALTVSR